MRAGLSTGTALAVVSALTLGACTELTEEEKNASLGDVNVIDASDLNDLMLNFADPDEAVTYFRTASASNPDRVDFQVGHAKALVKAKRYEEATVVLAKLVADGNATNEIRLDYADAMFRTGDWEKAKDQLDAIPPTYETYDRYRLEAMVADGAKDWKRADSFYETARGLTTRPAPILNNWGISNMARGNYTRAEELFLQAITFDDGLFSAKNNMVISRGLQGNYRLPILRVNETERAQLLYNLGKVAVNRGDLDIAKGLFAEAVDTSPRYFGAAVSALAELQDSVLR